MRNTINKLLWSFLHALVLLIATYLVWNIPDDWTDSGSWLQRIHLAQAVMAKPDTLPSDLVLINTCYDHEMVPVYDELGMGCGQLDITDRTKLLSLFQYLSATNDYRFIVCDIRFDSVLQSPADRRLFRLIGTMPRCVVPSSSEEGALPTSLIHQSAISEYHTNIRNNNFLKYQFLSSSGESMALRMARCMNGINIDNFGPLYLTDGKLCVNSHILDIKTNVMSEYRQDEDGRPGMNKKNILQLGSDVLPLIDAGVEGMFTDKIVMIGDCFREDIHTTVAGPVSGMMIIYNAYHALVSGYNVPPLWVWLSLMMVYALLTLAIMNRLEPHDLLPKRWVASYPVLCKVVDWIGFDILFTIIGILSFLFAKTYIDAWLCATYFTLFDIVYTYLHFDCSKPFSFIQKLLITKK